MIEKQFATHRRAEVPMVKADPLFYLKYLAWLAVRAARCINCRLRVAA